MTSIAALPSKIETETMRRITWRILPFFMLCYFIAYVDRVNAGFAALQMNKDLGLTPGGIRPGRRAVLHRLYYFRGPEQSCDAEGRRARLDRAHHGFVGDRRHSFRFRGRADHVLSVSLFVRRSGGRIFPRGENRCSERFMLAIFLFMGSVGALRLLHARPFRTCPVRRQCWTWRPVPARLSCSSCRFREGGPSQSVPGVR